VAVAEQSSVAVAAAKEKCGACNGKGYHTMQGEEYLEQCSPCKGTGKVKGFGITVPCGKCGQTGYVTKRGKDKRANCWKCNAKGKI
jgi:DnaJ-class molecular chaperone